jgi:F0F1-type ATP synthase assembly protein I
VIFIRSIKAYIITKDIYLKATILGLNSAFLAILVQYNFFSTLYIMHIWVLIGLIIAVQNIALSSKPIETKS